MVCESRDVTLVIKISHAEIAHAAVQRANGQLLAMPGHDPDATSASTLDMPFSKSNNTCIQPREPLILIANISAIEANTN